jgi:hypothetical protein
MTNVTVGGKEYLFDGMLLGGQIPAWKFVRYAGKPMTHDQFAALPDTDKIVLTEYVERHIKAAERRFLSACDRR